MKTLILLVPLLLSATSPFESPKPNVFNTSAYETQTTKETKMASENEKIKCRYICDKKLYKEQQIGAAVSYYKNLQKTRPQ
jgi:hypothetical protein